GLGPRHALRPAVRRPQRVDPDEPAAAGALGIRLPARAWQRRSAPGRLPAPARLAGGAGVSGKAFFATDLRGSHGLKGRELAGDPHGRTTLREPRCTTRDIRPGAPTPGLPYPDPRNPRKSVAKSSRSSDRVHHEL